MDQEAMTARPGAPEDWPRYRQLLVHCPQAAQWADGYPSLCIQEHEEILAFVLYRIVAGEGEILNLAVHPESRRRHFATALLNALLLEASIWHLEVCLSNYPAIKLYKSLGFKQTTQRPNYYNDGEAALLMSRVLA